MLNERIITTSTEQTALTGASRNQGLELKMKSLLSFRITVEHDDAGVGRPATPIYAHIKLYREDDEFVWRIDGELGDECETLPRPKSIEQAKADARAVYPAHSPFRPHADWL